MHPIKTLLCSFILLVIILPCSGCGGGNATVIKDGHIVLLKKGSKYTFIIPVEQRKSEKGYYMKFKYVEPVNRLEELKEKSTEKMFEDIIYDDGKVLIGGISATWTFKTNGEGYLYYGEIFGNYSVPVEICVTDAQKVDGIDFSLKKYTFLKGENNKRKRFRP